MILSSLDLTSLKNAISQLEDALIMYDSTHNNPRLQKHMRNSAIKCFEYTYELTFKTLKRHLEKKHANPELIKDMTFSDIIRESFSSDITCSDLSIWRKYRESRGITSHIYDNIKAQKVFESAKDFLQDARYTLNQVNMRDKPD